MAHIIKMPRLSDTMEEGNIVEWLKQVGDKVVAGDILAEVETDKATMELENYHKGTLLYIGKESGVVPVDGVIAVIGEEGEDFQAQLKAEQSNTPSKQEEKAEVVVEKTKATPAPAASTPSKAQETTPVDGRIKASPLARQIAEEKGIDISMISGTGEEEES